MTPGHEVVGEVVALGEGAEGQGFKPGDRAGAAWLRWTDGTCKYCQRGAENLCPHSRYTGWDADGGYAEYMTVPAAYAHRLPEGYDDAELAPLLCAGIIGYRALNGPNSRRAGGWASTASAAAPTWPPGGPGPRGHRARADPRRAGRSWPELGAASRDAAACRPSR